MDPSRYSRQVLFPGIGIEGQDAISKSRVVIIGCGALGSMQSEMLARAGVGRLKIIDRDFVELSNLHRQILFNERDARENQPKVVAAAKRLALVNSAVNVEPVVADVNFSNVEDLIADADVVLDGTDNFETRYLINDAAVKLGIPWVYGAAVGSSGLQMTVRPGKSPCLTCVWPESPAPGTFPTCDTGGVILPIIALIASLQVTETLKLVMGKTNELHSSLLQFDSWTNRYTHLNLANAKRADCRTCGQHNFEYLSGREAQMTSTLCGRNAVQVWPSRAARVDLEELASKMRNTGRVTHNKYLVRMSAEPYEITVFADGRSIIKGTEDTAIARSLYSRYVGA